MHAGQHEWHFFHPYVYIFVLESIHLCPSTFVVCLCILHQLIVCYWSETYEKKDPLHSSQSMDIDMDTYINVSVCVCLSSQGCISQSCLRVYVLFKYDLGQKYHAPQLGLELMTSRL